MKTILFCGIVGALLATPALAQQQRGNADFGARGGAVFRLPPNVQSIVSIDALNTVIIAAQGARRGETEYTPTVIQHVYSGGIARLFGGSAVPTAHFATPGQFGGSGVSGRGSGSGNNNGGFGGVQSNFKTQNGGGLNGFGNGATFQNGVLGGNGFNTQNRNVVTNARGRAR